MRQAQEMTKKMLALSQKAIKISLTYANTNLGAGIIIAFGTYLLTKGFREDELKDTKQQLAETREDNRFLNRELQNRDKQLGDLLHSCVDTQNQVSTVRTELLRCENNFKLLKYAYDNTGPCLFRGRYIDSSCEEKSDGNGNHLNQGGRI